MCYSNPYLYVLSRFTAPAKHLKIKVVQPRTAGEEVGGRHMEIFYCDNVFNRQPNNLLAACIRVCDRAVDDLLQPSIYSDLS